MELLIFDNGGKKTKDRYCVILNNKKVYTMLADPFSPGGVKYLCEARDFDRDEAGRSVEPEDLPKEISNAIKTKGVLWYW